MRIENPGQYLQDAGGLHDIRIPRFLFDAVRATIAFDVRDLDTNFEGLPGYTGPHPARLVFSGVGCFQTDVRDLARELWVSELTSAFAGDRHRATMVFTNGDRMAWDFTGFEVVDIPAADATNP